jgi:DNA repair exonuclease SbcCD ATPase subunit
MEIERKEASLQNIQAQLNTMESYKIQMENFKRQVGILEEKLKLYEGEFSHKNVFLSDQLKLVSEAENKLRSQVISKDKIIQELDGVIKDMEKQLNISRKQNVEKEKICEDIKQDFNEISQKFKNLQMKFNQKDQELRKYKEENEVKTSESTKEKAHLEEKMSQLITIVKQYSN